MCNRSCWGIRGLGRNRAYNVSGDRGVELLLADGRKVLIGSLRPDELEQAIVAARRSQRRAGEG